MKLSLRKGNKTFPLEYESFLSILTAARLYRYDYPYKPVFGDGGPEVAQQWHWDQEDLIDDLEGWLLGRESHSACNKLLREIIDKYKEPMV